jgi:hypothetical protein
MAKLCPMTGEKVLYTECTECEDRRKCKSLTRRTCCKQPANLGLKSEKTTLTRSLDEKTLIISTVVDEAAKDDDDNDRRVF